MKTRTFLTFVNEQCGKAEEAVTFYTSLFPSSEVIQIQKYTEGEVGGAPHLVKQAIFTINGTEYMASENTYEHAFSFSPAIAIYIECDTEEQIVQLFETLSEDGEIMMPLDDYGFSKKFGWCADKYGVSWQLSLL